MKVQLLDEPLLQFANKGTHVDIRAGIMQHGVFDLGASTAPVPIGVGLVGTTTTVDQVRDWLDSCKAGVTSPEQNFRELRPSFPGMQEGVFGTRLKLNDASTRTISRLELQAALSSSDSLDKVVELFADHARDLASRGGLHVLVIAPPVEVFTIIDKSAGVPDVDEDVPYTGRNFHDLFKARALDLSCPCQVLRPDTYEGGSTRVRGGQRVQSLQDPATRAWNFHTALYYKGGGVPWRLVRHSASLATCYVGASFFKSVDGEKLLTSVAQVFNERGEGLIVQGGNARIDRHDRTPHLSAADAKQLLSRGLSSYRREHRTMPARVVVHKTSNFDDQEITGFREAAAGEHVEILDLVAVRRSGTRLLRHGVPAVIRGTAMIFDGKSGIVYLKGTVPYFRTYPGMYIPRALEFSLDDGETPAIELAKELLELSKLNFNNTQFDSGDPITIRAAQRVSDILRHVPPGRDVQARFRHFT